MSEIRIDSAADPATTEHADEQAGQGLAAPGAHTDSGQGQQGLPSSVPGVGRDELGEDEQTPDTEGNRQAVETVRSISRLEESN